MRFSANISLLFTEFPFGERFSAAASAGFDAVEFRWPAKEAIEAIPELARRTGLQVAMINFYAGDVARGDRGVLALPRREHEFRANVPLALDLAAAVGCRRLNASLGVADGTLDRTRQFELGVRNVRWAADQAGKQGAMVLVEAANTIENGPCLLSRTSEVLEFMDRVGRDNVMMLHDVYHMQRMEGNLVATIRTHINRIGHIQIADCPGRHQPGTGEINYEYVLGEIERLGYDGFVGLEYEPAGATDESLGWLQAFKER